MSEEQLVYKKKKKKFKIFPIVNVIFFILVSLLILFPMWKVIVDSFDAHSATSFRWWPSSFSLGGYGAIITRASLYRPFLVSVITTLAGTFMGLLLAITIGIKAYKHITGVDDELDAANANTDEFLDEYYDWLDSHPDY